jgi:hypothetical protein
MCWSSAAPAESSRAAKHSRHDGKTTGKNNEYDENTENIDLLL